MRPLLLIVVVFVVGSPSIRAGQPLATDDAAIIPPKTCQLETWLRAMHGENQYWAVPACNVADVETTAGGARRHSDDEGTSSFIVLQGKGVFVPRQDGLWSFGALAGAVRATGEPHGRSAFQAYYAKALASWYPSDDLEIDLNLGAANAYGAGTFALAGVAMQYMLSPSLQLLGEWFRDEPGRSKYQVGLRLFIVPNRFEAYVSYGNRVDGGGDWWSVVGIRLQSPPFLPW